jgi:hypothetical protein
VGSISKSWRRPTERPSSSTTRPPCALARARRLESSTTGSRSPPSRSSVARWPAWRSRRASAWTWRPGANWIWSFVPGCRPRAWCCTATTSRTTN